MSNEKKAPKRRKQTKGEKEALRLRKIREKFGSSPVDPDEPSFSEGMPRNAIECAYKDARQTHSKPGLRFNAKVVASRTATTTGLNSEQKGELKTWLVWLNDRRYVTRDPYTSPVLQWALSGEGPDIWNGDTAPWRARVDRDHAKRQAAKREHAARKAAENHTETTKPVPFDAQRPDPINSDPGRTEHFDTFVSDGSDQPVLSDRPDPSSSKSCSLSSKGALNRPPIPYGVFVAGKPETAALFTALKEQSDEEVRKAALRLLAVPSALSEAMSRNPKISRYIEDVFRHFDLPSPGSKP